MNTRLTRLRRPLAALLAAVAASLALLSLRPAPPPSVRVLIAARDLPAGTTLTPSDLRHVNLPPATVPTGTLPTATGRTLTGPIRRGEPLTDARVINNALLRGYAPHTVATPVRIADADAAHLLHPGDHIDILTTPTQDTAPQHSRVVVAAVPVITVPPRTEATRQEGALVVLATTRPEATALAETGTPLSLTITSP